MAKQPTLDLQEAAAAAEEAAAWELKKLLLKDETTHTIEEQYTSALGRAIAYWRRGRIIPMYLAVELMAEGYDVSALQIRYLEV